MEKIFQNWAKTSGIEARGSFGPEQTISGRQDVEKISHNVKHSKPILAFLYTSQNAYVGERGEKSRDNCKKTNKTAG